MKTAHKGVFFETDFTVFYSYLIFMPQVSGLIASSALSLECAAGIIIFVRVIWKRLFQEF